MLLASACGEEANTPASGGSLAANRADSIPGLEGENRPPVIHSIEFKPPHILPGRPVRAQVDAVDPEGRHVDLRYRWTVRGRLSQETGRSLEVPSWARHGDPIQVEVVATDGQSDSETFMVKSAVANRRPVMLEIRIETQADEGEGMGSWIARPVAEDPDGDRLAFRYNWIINGHDSGHTGASFARGDSTRGDEIRLQAWASDGTSESQPLTSLAFSVGNSPPEIVSHPPPLEDSGFFLYVVRATDRDGDSNLAYSLEEGPKGMTIDSQSGEIRWQAVLENAGEHEVRITVEDGKGGLARQGFYVQVEMTLPPPRFGLDAR
jgi:hypothetical protein